MSLNFTDIIYLGKAVPGSGGGGGSSLPDQTGHSGEFLTTDGTDASWSDKPLVNRATGTNGIGIGGPSLVASGNNSIAVGPNPQATATGAIAIGVDARATVADGIAIGDYARSSANKAYQIGSGTNSTANSFQVGSHQLLNLSDGTIPEARLADTTNAQQGDVLTLDSNGDAVWQASSGGGLPSQTGNAGKFLTTDGTDASWSDKPLVNKDTHTRGLVVGGNNDTSGTGNTVIGSNSTSYGGNCNTVLGAFSQGRNASTVIGYGIQDSVSQNAVIIRSGAQYSGTVTGVSNAFCWIKGTTVYELFSADGTIPAARHASLPAADGTYTLQLVISNGVPTLSWVAV